MKSCPGCKIDKDSKDFYSNAARHDGLSGYCRVCHNNQGREYIGRLKDRAFRKLGDKCVRCEFSDRRALQFDHVLGGGRQDRLYKGPQTVLLDVIEDEDGKYQLLCANCNQIKKVENGEHSWATPKVTVTL